MMGKEKSRYRYVGTYADTLGNGQPVEPGEFVNLTEEDLEDSHNARLYEEGKLLSIEEAENPSATEAAEKLAQKESIDLASVPGTGTEGTITVDDVKAAVAAREEASA